MRAMGHRKYDGRRGPRWAQLGRLGTQWGKKKHETSTGESSLSLKRHLDPFGGYSGIPQFCTDPKHIFVCLLYFFLNH
jgi:hypothetical protein